MVAWAAPILMVAAGVSGCSRAVGDADRQASGDRPLRIVATTGMVADLARRVGGPWVEVQSLMGAGVDPHLYKASPGDVRVLIRADVVFYSGLHLEGKMGEIFRRLDRRKPTVAVTERLDPARLIETEGGAHDPHLWFDVGLWSEGIAVVRDALSRLDPAHAGDFAANASTYETELHALDAECRAVIATIPKGRRLLVTAHDAFGYFGRAYGVEVRGIQGLSTESEAGVREVNQLVDLLVRRDVPAVFVETSVSDRNVRALVEGCAARGHPVRVGGSLFSDAMGREGTPEGTYVGMVRHNVRTIVEALR